MRPGLAPIIVLHGLGSDHDGLSGFTEALPHNDIIALDLPGFGQSPPLPGTHTITAYAHALNGLCEQLGLEPVDLVGHSLGADIALAFAALYPHRVRALTLLNPVIAGSGPVSWLGRAYYRVATWLPEALARVWLLSRPAVYLSTSIVLSTSDRARRREILQHDYRTSASASPRAVCEAYLSLAQTPFADLARHVAAPTLLATGDRDALAAPRTVIALQGRLRNSRVVIIDRAGHLWPVEEPQAAADLVATNLL